ncbi:hypothetical protein B7494_g4180 [Chlorociboria aeruginascens]|nr:hypothetical protein B7494_g4180 [Chlorociboria aeruginascens]
MQNPHPLSILPLSAIVRSWAVTLISSSPILLPISLRVTSFLANSNYPLFSPARNPILHSFLKKTFYAQFCAGEDSSEVHHTIKSLKDLGYSGVILGYAREVVMSASQEDSLKSHDTSLATTAECIKNEIQPWAKGTLETVQLATPGDFVALKFTGAGSQALFALSREMEPAKELDKEIKRICDAAKERGVRLLFDAEQAAVQRGIDKWTLKFMRLYNGKGKGDAVIYGTYQAYLKNTPNVLAGHLKIAREEGWTLGAKLVRGAYLESDPRVLIYGTKEQTDQAYDGIAESLVRRAYGEVLKPAEGEKAFPNVDMVLAGHNHTSVRKILTIRKEQAERGEEGIELVYAQLQGMADNISCELVQAGKSDGGKKIDIPMAYKYLVWGTTAECMKYLLRRAMENKEAVQRTKEGRDAMAKELLRRMKKSVGLV